MRNETRFRMVEAENPERFKELLAAAEREIARRFRVYEDLAHRHPTGEKPAAPAPAAPTPR